MGAVRIFSIEMLTVCARHCVTSHLRILQPHAAKTQIVVEHTLSRER